MKKISILTVFALLSLSSAAFSVKDTTIVDFDQVAACVAQKALEYGETNVMVVLDIDNTILTSHTDLGGDIWYQWQQGELDDIKPTEEQKIKECFYEDVIGLLYELGTMGLTETSVPDYIQTWQEDGITVFALTSRSPDYRQATERELKKNGIDLSGSPLKTIDGNTVIYDYNIDRPMSYQNGIMMTTGMDKGKMLAHILGRTGRSCDAIIFVDDSQENIDAVREEFIEEKEIDISLFRYDKVITDRKLANGGVILTKEQAAKMTQDWNLLNSTINSIFTGRYADGKCVNSD